MQAQVPRNKERDIQEQMEYYDAVMARFDGNCVVCYPCRALGVTVHEIVPRSQLPRSWWKDINNGAPVCSEHHNLVHMLTSKEAKAMLDIHIEKTLRAMGKSVVQ